MTWGWDRWYILTDRARKNFVVAMTNAVDNSGYYMISVPNRVQSLPVLMKVDAIDHKLSEEAYLKTAKGILKENRNINDYYVTAMATLESGKLLAYSLQYSTLLVVNPYEKTVESAYAMPKLNLAHSMTIKGNTMIMLGRDGNKDIIYELELPKGVQ